MRLSSQQCRDNGFIILASLSFVLVPLSISAQTSRPLPDHVPPKRSSQIHDGFGINSDLPRGSLSSLEPLVVDPDVRRRVQVGAHWPV